MYCNKTECLEEKKIKKRKIYWKLVYRMDRTSLRI